MARPGYVKARQEVQRLRQAILDTQARFEVINALPDGLRQEQTAIVNTLLSEFRSALSTAEAVFAGFQPVKAPRKPKQYFEVCKPFMLAFTSRMFEASRSRCQQDGIRFPELIRRALAAYLGIE